MNRLPYLANSKSMGRCDKRSSGYISAGADDLTTINIHRLFRQTALFTVLFGSVLSATSTASASETIDGGQVVTFPTTSQLSWSISGDLIVGNTSSGSLTINNGGVVNDVRGYIGNALGSTGGVEVSGNGSKWTNSTLFIGNKGNGTLLITHGGIVGNGTSYIGGVAGSTGRVDVSGAGSRLDGSGDLYIGQFGQGTLTITDGGVVKDSNGYIGYEVNSTGLVDVSGAGSQWNNDSLVIGNKGNGTLTITDGGIVSSTYKYSSGMSSGRSYIGHEAGSTGLVEMSDAAQWNNTGNLVIGNKGNGTLTINNGSMVKSSSGVIGSATGSTGRVDINGSGSQWNTGSLDIGSSGRGVLTITQGEVISNGNVFIGVYSGSTGSVEVSDAAQWNSISSLFIGNRGNGTLTITRGGMVNSSTGSVGNMPGSTGRVDIYGIGSQWNTGALDLGKEGSGTLTIADRAAVSASSLIIASKPAGSGTLNIGNGGLGGTLNAASITGANSAAAATVNFNHTDDINFTPQMTGALTVNQINQGTTTLTSGNNDYTGVTTVSAGTLQAGATGAFSQQSDFIIEAGGQLDLAGYNQTISSLNNAGTVSLNGTSGTVLTISGDYTGNNSLLNFNTILHDDMSVSDKLVIGGNSAGITRVSVTNAGGSGASTLNGIQLIEVNGQSDGEFTQAGRIVAGAYDYKLARGTGINAGHWYLTNEGPTLTPDPIDNPGDTPIDDPVPAPAPSPASGPDFRPEVGSYMANMAAASKMFNLRLEDREGRAENSSMWLRQLGSRTTFHDTTGQSRTATNTYVVQGGGEVWNSHFNDIDRLGVGLMAAYGNASSETGSNRSGYHSKGSVDGYSTGVYATWYQDAASLNGIYVDSWMQYSWLNGEVKGDQLSNESYDIDGLSASVETGYRIPVYQGQNGNVYITPQAQVIWSGISADDHHEVNGTRVTSSGDNNVQTRLGVKVSRDGVSDSDIGKDKLFTLYAEANWLNNSQQAGAVLDGVEVKQSGSRNLAELKLGTEGQINKNLNLWTNVAQQMGDDGYSDTALTVGIKYRF